jgi:Tyrosine phosphatase family
MAATLKIIREKYGGAEGYLTGHASLTEKDLDEIRKNFLVPRPLVEDQV